MKFKEAPIGAVFDVRNGATPASENPAFWDGDISWVGPVDLGQLTVRHIEHGKRSITHAGYTSCGTQLVPPGTILLSTRAPIGHVAIASREICFNQGCRGLVPRNAICSDFAYWALLARIPQLEAAGQGTTFLELSRDKLKAARIPLPDLPTQKAIADFLDRETARIDQLIEKKRRFINLANERWVSELNDAVFPTFSNWSHLPGEWKKVRLKYLTDPMRPIMYGIVLPGPNVEFGKLIVKGGDVKPGRLDPELLCKTTIEIESSYVRSRVKAGDLIISIRGGIGDLEVVPKTIEGANLTQDAARIAPRSGIDVEWLRYALSAPVVFHLLEAKSLGAAVRGINIFDLKRVSVPTPPFETQTRIRDGLVATERRLARLKERVVQHTEKIQEFRSALITASVTGQIDVSTWSKQGMTDRRFDQIEEATSA